MARRKRKTLLERKDRQKPSRRSGISPVPRLGRRKALWRFVGALALAPLGTTAFAQDGMMPGPMPGVASLNSPDVYTPEGYPPVLGPVHAGYQGAGPGYVTPVQGYDPYMVQPQFTPQFTPQGAPGIAIPESTGFTPRLVTTSGAGDGLGWGDGYTSIGAWLPLGLNSDTSLLYLDARGFTSWEESGGGNFTLGYRSFLPGFNRFVGVYAAYDIDAGNPDSTTFDQVAVGVESVGKFLTYRANGYIPLSTEGEVVATGVASDPFFRGNNIILLDRTLIRYQYGGMDAEIGGPLPGLGKYGLSGFLGGYWLTSDVDDTVGFQGRLEANINDDLQIGGKLTSDDIFETNVWATLTVRSPRGSWANFFRKDWLLPPSVQTQMDRAPERNTRVTTDLKRFDTESLAINPADGLPYFVLHVNPNGGSGNGTFENPSGGINGFNNPLYDIVYVQPGTVRENGPIQLFNDQRLLSTSVSHLFDTQRGLFELPGRTGGPLPLLLNTQPSPSTVVALANNNEVSGFNINGNGMHTGIAGPPTGITGFNINRNVIANVATGASIVHVGIGTGVFNSNQLTGVGLIPTLTGPGFDLEVLNGQLGLSMVDNSIQNFAGAGAAIVERGNANVSLTAVDNDFSNNVDDIDPLSPFFGQGMFIELSDAAQLTNSVIDRNSFVGNDASGLEIDASGTTSIINVLIGNQDGDNDNGNVFASNAFDGLRISRSGAAVVDGLAIVDNLMSDNGIDGVAIDAAGSLNDELTLLLSQNQIEFNGDDGISFFVEGNAVINGTVTNNNILANGQLDLAGFDSPLFLANGDYSGVDTGDGVSFEQNRFTINPGSVTGIWAGNVIASNVGFGVNSTAPTNGLVFGTPDSGNVITRNGLTGVGVFGPGTASYTNNLIAENGLRLASSGQVPGGDADSVAGGIVVQGLGFKDLTFVSNRIQNNLGDGVEIANRNNLGGFGFTLNFVDNVVAENTGRGYDILNAGDASTDITIRGTTPGLSVISENGREAVYVVNTSASQQSQKGLAPFINEFGTDPTHGMLADGAVDSSPFLTFTFVNNDVVSNGNALAANGLPSAGVVLRVGTAGGDYFFTNNGGFAATGRPGVVATITDNRLKGNLGADVYAESFVSTTDPAATAGTWNGTEFDVDDYTGDPLARLDLTFVNNSFESVDFDNPGAFYNNADANFKSRTFGRTAPDPNGPFLSGSRRRNAQRVGFRDGLPPFVAIGASDSFLFPGMGESTFRISTSTLTGTNTVLSVGGAGTPVGAGAIFFIDNQPYTSEFDANGVFVVPVQPDDMPYGWSVF